MKHFFVDTNVVLDLLAKRLPYVVEAIPLFDAAAEGKVMLYVASLSFSNLHYILRKATSSTIAIELLSDLTQLIQIVSVDDMVVRKALAATMPDFEDALQYFAATTVPTIEAIITRDPKGFQASTLPVMTPAEALQQLM